MAKLIELIEKMRDVRAMVVGDAMVDQYLFGRVDRMCPEAPVPVFIAEEVKDYGGGAAHVADQLDALCKQSITCFQPRPHTLKKRFMVGSHMLLRHDTDMVNIALDDEQRIRLFTKTMVPSYDVIVLSDYAKGWLSEKFCKFIIKTAGVPVVVDPKGRLWSKYIGCTAICPNDKEISSSWLGIPHVLHKRGPDGLRLYGPLEGTPPSMDAPIGAGRPVQDFPASARHVYNVTGAGDTVTAVVAAVVAAGGTLQEACILANLAAGFCVGEVGTTVCTRDKLIELVKERKC